MLTKASRELFFRSNGFAPSRSILGEVRRAYLWQVFWMAIVVALATASIISFKPEHCDSIFLDSTQQNKCLSDIFVHRLKLWLTLIGALIVVGVILSALNAVAQTAHQKAREIRERLRPPSQKVIVCLEGLLTPIRARLAMTRPFEIFVDLDNYHWVPSVAEDRKGAILVIPVGFLKLCVSDRAGAVAILGHELGHVEERDSSIFPILIAHSNSFHRKVVHTIRLYQLAYMIIVLHGGFLSMSLFLAMTFANVSAYRAKHGLMASRLASEKRADMYAWLSTGDMDIIRVLRQHTHSEEAQSPFHPKIPEREHSLEESVDDLRELMGERSASPSGAQVQRWRGVMRNVARQAVRRSSMGIVTRTVSQAASARSRTEQPAQRR